jgi:hypothetical protein
MSALTSTLAALCRAVDDFIQAFHACLPSVSQRRKMARI